MVTREERWRHTCWVSPKRSDKCACPMTSNRVISTPSAAWRSIWRHRRRVEQESEFKKSLFVLLQIYWRLRSQYEWPNFMDWNIKHRVASILLGSVYYLHSIRLFVDSDRLEAARRNLSAASPSSGTTRHSSTFGDEHHYTWITSILFINLSNCGTFYRDRMWHFMALSWHSCVDWHVCMFHGQLRVTSIFDYYNIIF